MTFYVIVFFFLWGGFFASILAGRRIAVLEYLALAVFILVAGQRFETGNDWLVYRDHYETLQMFGFSGAVSEDSPVFEPLYVFVVWFLGLFLSFQAFLLVVSLFNGVVLYWFSRVWGANFSGVVAIYYSWLYLAAQMATVRYSIAVSFFLLAVVFLLRGRRWGASLFVIISIGFHVFSIALVPVLLLIDRRLDFRRMFFVLVAVGLGVYFLFSVLIDGLGDGIPFLGKLIFYYREGAVQGVSLGLIVYIMMNSAFLVFVRGRLNDGGMSRLVGWSVLYLLFFQVVLWALPIFWSRVQVFALTIQACVISRYLVDRRHVALASVGMMLSFFVLWRSLSAPAFVSYVPYQSYWVDQIFLGSARGDGEDRYLEAMKQQQLSGEK